MAYRSIGGYRQYQAAFLKANDRFAVFAISVKKWMSALQKGANSNKGDKNNQTPTEATFTYSSVQLGAA